MIAFPRYLAVLTISLLMASAASAQTTTAPASKLTRDIEYGVAGPNKVSLKLDLCVPSQARGPVPIAIIIHGGGWSSGDKAKDITPLFDPLTSGGFAWVSINYRLAPANRWPACLEDVQTAIKWVKAHAAEYNADPNRIVLIGHSAGGHLACLAATLADKDTQVQAVIGLAPVTDQEQDLLVRKGLSTSLQALLDRPKDLTPESLAILHEISPINHIHAGLPPFLVMQGDADKTVPLQQSLNFQAKLKEAQIPCDLITVKGAPHTVLDWDKFDPSYKVKLIDWLKKTFAGPTSRPG